jgi:CRISPR/Cas system CSM-associated protein Csm2 small subunit
MTAKATRVLDCPRAYVVGRATAELEALGDIIAEVIKADGDQDNRDAETYKAFMALSQCLHHLYTDQMCQKLFK